MVACAISHARPGHPAAGKFYSVSLRRRRRWLDLGARGSAVERSLALQALQRVDGQPQVLGQVDYAARFLGHLSKVRLRTRVA